MVGANLRGRKSKNGNTRPSRSLRSLGFVTVTSTASVMVNLFGESRGALYMVA